MVLIALSFPFLYDHFYVRYQCKCEILLHTRAGFLIRLHRIIYYLLFTCEKAKKKYLFAYSFSYSKRITVILCSVKSKAAL